MEYVSIRESDRAYQVEYSITRIIDLLVALVEMVLGLRLVLHFFGANPSNPFMSWLGGITDQLLAPFAGIFPSWTIGGFVLEISTLFAMLAYAVIGWLVIRLIHYLFGLSRV